MPHAVMYENPTGSKTLPPQACTQAEFSNNNVASPGVILLVSVLFPFSPTDNSHLARFYV